MAFYRNEETGEVAHPECIAAAVLVDSGTWAKSWIWKTDGDRETLDYYDVPVVGRIPCAICGAPLGKDAKIDEVEEEEILARI